MSYDLIYDAVTTSEAPGMALEFALGFAAAAVLWGGWLKMRGHALHAGVKFVAGGAVLMLLISALYSYEQYRIATRSDVKIAEGPVAGYWNKQERVRNSDGSYSTIEWEGFWLNGVSFVYRRHIEQNYFHNSGSSAIELKDGVQLRLRYVTEDNQIVRVERAVLP